MSKTIRVTCEGAALVPLSSLRNFQGALKKLMPSKFDKLKNSLEKYGFAFPLFAWKDKRGANQIVDGHQRILVLRRMLKDGYTLDGGKIPVAWIEAKTLREAREKVLLAVSQYGRYDDESVYEFLTASDIPPSMLTHTFDLQSLDMKEFDARFYGPQAGIDVPETAKSEEIAAERKKISARWKVQKGDLWEIPSKTVRGGSHLVKCGDSTDWKDVAAVIGDGVDLVISDPPYELDASKVRQSVKMFSDRAVLLLTGGQALRIARDGWDPKLELIWKHAQARTGPSPTNNPLLYHSTIVCMAFGKTRLQWRRPRPGFGSIIELDRDENVVHQHTHAKSVELFRQLLSCFSFGRVADPFLGSGTTLRAAEIEGKTLVGMELEPEYVALTLDGAAEAGLKPKRLSP